MLDLAYISSFLRQVEGFSLRGYVPCKRGNYKGDCDPAGYTAIGASGVTIASGVDLGQQTRDGLLAFGLPGLIVNFFLPYLGRRKANAIDYLWHFPFAISRETAEQTNEFVHGGYLRQLVCPAYARASGHELADQPVQAQAVIMSLCYQKGCAGVARDWPVTWKHLCARDWAAAAHELTHNFRQYPSRRKREGRLLLELVK